MTTCAAQWAVIYRAHMHGTHAQHTYLMMAAHMLDSKCSLRGFGRIASWNRNISHCSQAAADSLQPCRGRRLRQSVQQIDRTSGHHHDVHAQTAFRLTCKMAQNMSQKPVLKAKIDECASSRPSISHYHREKQPGGMVAC